MALANPITWQHLCAEFSLAENTAVFPRDFYSKGGAPSSGTLSFQDFVGRSGGSAFTPMGGTYSDADSGTSVGGLGSSYTITSNSGPVTWTWTKTSGSASASSTISNGGSASSITFNLPGTTGTSSSATFTVSAGGQSWTVNLSWSGNL